VVKLLQSLSLISYYIKLNVEFRGVLSFSVTTQHKLLPGKIIQQIKKYFNCYAWRPEKDPQRI
jgi:hypothetical protein